MFPCNAAGGYDGLPSLLEHTIHINRHRPTQERTTVRRQVFSELTTKCGWFQPLLIIKAYEDKKRKCDSTYRAEHFLLNSEIFTLQTNFWTKTSQSIFAAHLRWFQPAYGTLGLAINAMFFTNRIFSPEVIRTEQKNLARELDQGC